MDDLKKRLALEAYENVEKEAEKARVKQIELLEQMSFMISHKLRSPVCSLLGVLPILNDATASLLEKHLYIDLISQSAAKIDTFTKELSKFIESIKIGLLTEQSKISKMKFMQIFS